ncbi:MAG: acyl-CoA thioesterase [Alistipes finegoldii]
MLSYDCQIRVWYKHTDQMAICHHSNYICYYEAARSELLRWLGMSFAEVEKRGIMMPILEVQSKYHRPAYYDELLTVRIMLKELPTARINFFYEIYNEKGDLLNTGMTQLGFIHSDTRRPCRVPDWFLQSGHQQVDGGVEAAATPPMIPATARLRSDAMAETPTERY